MNAFFSGSVKGGSTFPYFFPTNINYDDKHPNIDPNNSTVNDITFSTVSLVKGYLEKDQYEGTIEDNLEMLKKKWFGFDVPI